MSSMVSIAIATYKAHSFITETLDFIDRQTYPNLETILVDDGSPDDTVLRVRSHSLQVKLFEQTNKGRGAARNRAIQQAAGEYVALLDHDDLLEAHSIERRVAYMEENPHVGWVFSDAVEFDETGDRQRFLDQFPWLNMKDDIFSQLLRGVFPLTSTVMIRRDLLIQVGGFNEDLRYGEDLELFMRLALTSSAGMIQEPLTRRRMHPEQGSAITFDRWDSRVRIFTSFTPTIGTLSPSQLQSISRWLHHAHFKMGEWYWEHLSMNIARGHFAASIGLYSWTLKATMYWLASLLPGGFILRARDCKRLCSRMIHGVRRLTIR